MTTSHLVITRNSEYCDFWINGDGSQWGPFPSLDDALDHARYLDDTERGVFEFIGDDSPSDADQGL